MSIEISGPKGYEYQYLATVYTALNLYADDTPLKEFYIEKVNGEDAELIYQDTQGGDHSIEIQVKSDAAGFDLAFLADVLCHFGGKQSVHNLASRIIANKGKKVIIISQGRCNDATAHFLVNAGTFSRPKIQIPNRVNEDLIELIGNHEKDATTLLKKSRHQFCIRLAADLRNDQVMESLIQHVLIYEKMAHSELREKCQNILFKALNIPLLQTDTVLDNLIKSIIDGRDKRLDIGKAFQLVIDENQAARPEIKKNYLRRPEEQRLINKLNNRNSLLLKGRSLCGKSSTAKAVARYFTERGYAYSITSNFDDAERFLLSSDKVDKVCLLDDPLGFIYQELKSPEIWQRVMHLRDALPPGKKLIITANNDVLTRLNKANAPEWIDLTLMDKQVALEIWQRLSRPEMPAAITRRVSAFISNSPAQKILQPGQLSFLSNNWSELENNPDEDIWKVAAVDAGRIVDTITSRGTNTIRTFRAMGLVCNTIVPIKLPELNYLFSSETTFPGFRDKRFGLPGRAIMNLEDKTKDYFPQYPSPQSALYNWQQELDFLTKSGYLNYTAGGYQFAHPVYCQAAQDLLSNLQLGEADEVLTDLTKATSLLAFENALIAARMMGNIIAVNNNEDVVKLIIQLAIEMENSIYPALIDESLILLSANSNYLDHKELDNVQTRLTGSGIDRGSIRWHNGFPFIPNIRYTGVRLDLDFGKIGDQEYHDFKKRLENDKKPELTSEEAWNFCNYLKFHSKNVPLEVDELALNKLLDYNETYIRSIVAFHIFHQFSSPPDILVQKALNDSHPFVILNCVKGFIRGWHKYDAGVKEALLDKVLLSFNKIRNVTAATNFITQFGVGYSTYSFDWQELIPEEYQPEMWRLWGLFIVKFFEKIPSDIHFNTHRFIQTIREAEKILSVDEQGSIAMAWLKWMKASYRYSRYSDNLFYVGSFYLSFSESLPAERQIEYVDLLIDVDFKYFTSNNIRLFLHKWRKLSKEEKAPIIKLASKPEETFFHAIMLTSGKCPDELSTLILGKHNWQREPATEIVNLIPRNLLEKCLSISFLTDRLTELSFSSRKIWFGVLGYFLFEQDVLCKLAIKVLLDQFFYPSQGKPVNKWGNTKQLLTNLIIDQDLRQYVYYLMLQEICNENSSDALPLWKLLKKNTDTEFHNFIQKGFKEHIKEIEMTDNLELVFNLWGNKFFEANFRSDTLISLMLKGYYDFDDPLESLTETMAGSIESIFRQSPPELRVTIDKVISFAKKNKGYDSLLEIAEESGAEYFKDKTFVKLENLDRLIVKDFEPIYINLSD